MFAGMVIVFNPVADTTFSLGHGFIGIEIYLFIFDAAPDTLYEYIISSCAPAIHTDLDVV
jgi:hypothetical protein